MPCANRNKFRSILLICIILLLGLLSGFPASAWEARALAATEEPITKTIKGRVKTGDTLSSILNPHLPLRTIYDINEQTPQPFSMARIKKGQPYKIVLKNKTFSSYEYEIDDQIRLVVEKTGDRFRVFQAPIEYDIQMKTVSAVIRTTLFDAVRRAKEKGELAMRLSDIFAWDIDFFRDLRPQDSFKVLVEKRYRDGKFCGYGKIRAAFFTNQGVLFKAFLFKGENGVYAYYDEYGNSLQKAFLKAPLSFSRISSGFSWRRLHPIFKEYRPHPGIDYAAPIGTPIQTVGDGVIVKIGYDKGAGKFINIRHFNGYVSSYFHMSRFAKGMKKNRRLVQGDVIGFVGMTGYSTGPHLDFRMKKNGSLINPLKHRYPSAKPVSPDKMDLFLAKREQLSHKLHSAIQTARKVGQST